MANSKTVDLANRRKARTACGHRREFHPRESLHDGSKGKVSEKANGKETQQMISNWRIGSWELWSRWRRVDGCKSWARRST